MVQMTTAPAKASLYDTDYYAWIEQQVALLRRGQTDAIDWVNLAEEVADMGRSQKQAVTSNLVVILTHLLKYHYQPEQRSNNWLGSIREHRRRLRDAFEDSPSLRRHAQAVFMKSYHDAREQAADETGLPLNAFPENCPYSLEQALDPAFLPG